MKRGSELPPEQVRIANVDFHDRLKAVLTLDDGRQLVVQLVGSTREQLKLEAAVQADFAIYLLSQSNHGGCDADNYRGANSRR